jgi:hypothetical protein
MAQIFMNDIKYMHIFPMKQKSEAGNTLLELIQDIGIPSALHCDGAQELQYGKWKDVRIDYGIKQTITEPYSPWQNHAKVNIREAKKAIQRLMHRIKTPKPLWDYCATYVAEIMCFTANDLYALHGRTPHEVVTGNTPDISKYTDFEWYEPIFYYDDAPFPEPKRIIAEWLGVAHRAGQALCYWILTKTSKVLACTSIQKMNTDESNSLREEINEFDMAIHTPFHGNTHTLDDTDNNTNAYLQDIYESDMLCLPLDADATMPEDDDTPEQEVYDQYISAQVMLPRGDTFDKATVLRRKRGNDGNLISRTHTNPILDMSVFEVQFSGGYCSEYPTNVIAENIYATVDDENR